MPEHQHAFVGTWRCEHPDRDHLSPCDRGRWVYECAKCDEPGFVLVEEGTPA